MQALLIISLLPIIYTDFKSRYVTLWSIALFWIAALSYFLFYNNINKYELAISYIVLLIISILSILITLLAKRQKLKASDIAGAGDLLFFLPIPLLLGPIQLIQFLIASCVAGIAGFLVLSRKDSSEKSIPLAGWGSICLIPFILLNHG